jgi:hypothetical protein
LTQSTTEASERQPSASEIIVVENLRVINGHLVLQKTFITSHLLHINCSHPVPLAVDSLEITEFE